MCWDHSMLVNDGDGTVAVVDGRNLHVTPLACTVVPPPTYAFTVLILACVIEVAHCEFDNDDSNKVSMVARLSNRSLVLVGRETSDDEPTALCTFCTTTGLEDPSSLRHLVAMTTTDDDDDLIVLAVAWHSSASDELVELRLLSSSDSPSCVCNRITLEGRVLRARGRRNNRAVLQLVDGTLLSYGFDASTVPPFDNVDIVLGDPCPWMSVIENENDDDETNDDSVVVVGCLVRNRLWRNDVLIDDAVSLHVVDDHVLGFTTLGSNSRIRVVPLSKLRGDDYNSLGSGLDNDDRDNDKGRPVERDSVIVTLLSDADPTPQVVLQLQPRGNLEVIFPKSLVIPHMLRLLGDESFAEAVELGRRQQLDLNLIVDVDPSVFLYKGRVEELVRCVTNPDRLNLFVANLKNGDVTSYHYPVLVWLNVERTSRWGDDVSDNDQQSLDLSNKVNVVCGVLRWAMMTVENEDDCKHDLLLPILSTLAKEEPPKLEDALLLVRDQTTTTSTCTAITIACHDVGCWFISSNYDFVAN